MLPRQKLDAPRQIIAKPSAREQRLHLIARQRLAAIDRFLKARAAGATNSQAARLAGASRPSLWRWRKAFDQYSLEGLVPGFARCGRSSELLKLRVPKWVLRRVERIALHKRCTTPAAWKKFARSPECPPRIAARVRQGTPPSFLAATALLTVKVKARFGAHLPARESLALALKEANL